LLDISTLKKGDPQERGGGSKEGRGEGLQEGDRGPKLEGCPDK
jgi:hypothetical protein